VAVLCYLAVGRSVAMPMLSLHAAPPLGPPPVLLSTIARAAAGRTRDRPWWPRARAWHGRFPRILEIAMRAALQRGGVAVVVIPGEVFLADAPHGSLYFTWQDVYR
jgi:hypothetical protein